MLNDMERHVMQELSLTTQEKDQLYIEKTELYESLRKEQLARTSASKEKQAQLRIVAIEVGLCKSHLLLTNLNALFISKSSYKRQCPSQISYCCGVLLTMQCLQL